MLRIICDFYKHLMFLSPCDWNIPEKSWQVNFLSSGIISHHALLIWLPTGSGVWVPRRLPSASELLVQFVFVFHKITQRHKHQEQIRQQTLYTSNLHFSFIYLFLYKNSLIWFLYIYSYLFIDLHYWSFQIFWYFLKNLILFLFLFFLIYMLVLYWFFIYWHIYCTFCPKITDLNAAFWPDIDSNIRIPLFFLFPVKSKC